MKKYTLAAAIAAAATTVSHFPLHYTPVMAEENKEKRGSAVTAPTQVLFYVADLAQKYYKDDMTEKELDQLEAKKEYTISQIEKQDKYQELKKKMDDLAAVLNPMYQDYEEKSNAASVAWSKYSVESDGWRSQQQALEQSLPVSEAEKASEAADQAAGEAWKASSAAYDKWQADLQGVNDLAWQKSDLESQKSSLDANDPANADQIAALEKSIAELDSRIAAQKAAEEASKKAYDDVSAAATAASEESEKARKAMYELYSLKSALNDIPRTEANPFDAFKAQWPEYAEKASKLFADFAAFRPLYNDAEQKSAEAQKAMEAFDLPQSQMNLLYDELKVWLNENYPDLLTVPAASSTANGSAAANKPASSKPASSAAKPASGASSSSARPVQSAGAHTSVETASPLPLAALGAGALAAVLFLVKGLGRRKEQN